MRRIILLASIAMLALSTILYGCEQTSPPAGENREVAAKKPEKVVVNEGLSKEEEKELSQRLEELENEVRAEDEVNSQEQQYTAETSFSEDQIEADIAGAAEDYYQAVDQENWAYTYENLDSQTKSLFSQDEWYLKNQYFADTEGLELSSMGVVVNSSPTEVAPVSVMVYRTFKDGTSIERETYFVREGGSWKHRFTQEEIDIFMPGVPYEDFVTQQGGSTSSATASATATASAPSSGDLDCSDFATQAEAQAALEEDLTDPHGLDADGNLLACEDLPGGEQYDDSGVSTNQDLDGPDGRDRRRPRFSSNPAPPPSREDIDCDEVDGPIPTPPGDPDNLDGDGDGWACE